MTLASKITLVRVAMIPAFMVTMYLSGGAPGMWMYISLAIFIIASLTDSLDGYIARHYNQVTDFGKFLDPLADKLLVIAAMCMFCQWGVFPAWALMIVLTREFAVTGLRLIAVQKGHVIAAGWSGKVKTASTMVGLCDRRQRQMCIRDSGGALRHDGAARCGRSQLGRDRRHCPYHGLFRRGIFYPELEVPLELKKEALSSRCGGMTVFL